MKILATSDLHGSENGYRSFAYYCKKLLVDIGIICGDMTEYAENMQVSENRYKPILDILGIPILFLMGNDDEYTWQDGRNCININERVFKTNSLSFIGYQYTNPFVGGIFERTERSQEADLEKIKNLIVGEYVLVTHGPPYGILDENSSGLHVGSKALLNFIKTTKPKYHIFGHIHESWGADANHFNVSYYLSQQFCLIDTNSSKHKFIK